MNWDPSGVCGWMTSTVDYMKQRTKSGSGGVPETDRIDLGEHAYST